MCIIVCLTPVQQQMEQSMSSLRFGMSARQVENRVRPNVVVAAGVAGKEEEALRMVMREYERRIREIEGERREQEEKREKEVKIMRELLEERQQWQARQMDTARVISRLEGKRAEEEEEEDGEGMIEL